MDTKPNSEFPIVGVWRLTGAYEGHEIVRITENRDGAVVSGTSIGLEGGMPWCIRYTISVTKDWRVRAATIAAHDGLRIELATDGNGSWTADGEGRPDLDGCTDLDLEASVVTNTPAVHRLSLRAGQSGESDAVYIRTDGLRIERLPQTYRRLPDADGAMAFDYRSHRFDYRDTLIFSPDGLVVNYPGISTRVFP